MEGLLEAEHLPDGVVVGFFSEAGSNGGTLLLDDSSFVGDGLSCAHIADKLFYCEGIIVSVTALNQCSFG
jgi:hypothetical protein